MAAKTGASWWTGRSRWIVGGLLIAAAGVLTARAVSRAGLHEGTIPAGTRLVGALGSGISTERHKAGTRVTLTTTAPIALGEGETIPEGATIRGEVTHSEGGGRIAGAPELTLRFHELSIAGRDYPILAEPWRVRGKNDAGQSAALIGGGAVVGGVVGAVAGKTVEGVVVGAVLGTGVAVATKGNQIVLPAGQRLRVTLTQPVTVRYKPAEEKQPD